MRFQDITGQRFGEWTVVERCENDANNDTIWLCRCSCGSLTKINAANLQSGASSRCLDCKYRAKTQSVRVSVIRRHLSAYKSNAKDRNLTWNLSDEEFESLVTQNCFYCDSAPTLKSGWKAYANRKFPVNGIDRFDNSLGYTTSNCKPCCTICNLAKKTLHGSEFIRHCAKIAEIHS